MLINKYLENIVLPDLQTFLVETIPYYIFD